MRYIMIVLTLTLTTQMVFADYKMCDPITSAVELGVAASNCNRILNTVVAADEQSVLESNKHCKQYISTKDDVADGIAVMHVLVQQTCLSLRPEFKIGLGRLNQALDTLNPVLHRLGY